MKYSIPRRTYVILLIISFVITAVTFVVQDDQWEAIITSLGAGGIASVCVAWLLDVRNAKIRTIENKRKKDELMDQFVRIYRKMMMNAAYACYGYETEGEEKTFRQWLSLLGSIAPFCPEEGQASIKRRCAHVLSSIIALQNQIEIFQSQSVTLVFEDFPELQKALSDLNVIWIHIWGTMKLLESENYKAFCDTTYILYSDFIKAFPQYQESFPEKYSIESFKP